MRTFVQRMSAYVVVLCPEGAVAGVRQVASLS